ncbi:MAG: hypothetical protein U9N47_06780 [Thermodesulfobacteriota bacterium]|nr:hypothetical protein [Thermodesulfobacteriota bacterium]
MRTTAVRSEGKEQEKAVAVRAVQQKKTGQVISAMTDNRQEAVTQRKLAAMITGSPGGVAQKKQPAPIAGIIQKQPPPEEEELFQGKLAAQMQSLDEDEIAPS